MHRGEIFVTAHCVTLSRANLFPRRFDTNLPGLVQFIHLSLRQLSFTPALMHFGASGNFTAWPNGFQITDFHHQIWLFLWLQMQKKNSCDSMAVTKQLQTRDRGIPCTSTPSAIKISYSFSSYQASFSTAACATRTQKKQKRNHSDVKSNICFHVLTNCAITKPTEINFSDITRLCRRPACARNPSY